MSNKIVPTIYRAVIDDVIAAIKSEFDEFGVPEDVLAELQHKWEHKVIASHVAEFESPQQATVQPPVTHAQPIHQTYPPHPMHMIQTHPHYANPYAAHMAAAAAVQPAGQATVVKTEPVDNRYMLNGMNPYALSPLPGPNVASARPTLPPHPGAAAARPAYTPPQPASQLQSAPANSAHRIPQVDGPSESSDDESPSPPPSAFAPRTNHPSLPQPSSATPRQKTPVDSEAINSDLDDSDTDNEEEADEGGSADADIVFCTYDKVARVKNKWKCTLKDGMIHVNGKDYLFAKCGGEFEW
ncbi:transcription factor IIA, alpha/beta subunit [Coprinopsis marcescibilis]|uniref:Transcription factor IIA, alpha/beta subunit n=1 Tax=Coprinopsis marcescibilis TaxID=230819 RepID=A0A5C3KXJ9_COPMA|nr:transcription factor IIA, alpha/beta subunit [Coprinopsis marcescibilis]